MAKVSATQEFMQRKWRPPNGTTEEQLTALSGEHQRRALLQQWPDLKLGALDGKSPREAAQDETYKKRVLGAILIVDGHQALTRARRRHRRWDTRTRTAYQRHRWKVEGVHGESKTQHGLRRAVRRNLANIAIQAYLTAAVINLKRLATAASGTLNHLFAALKAFIHTDSSQNILRLTITNKPAHKQKRNWKTKFTTVAA